MGEGAGGVYLMGGLGGLPHDFLQHLEPIR